MNQAVLSECGGWSAALAFIVAVTGSWLVTKLLIPVLRRRKMLDIPGARSSHSAPTPRGGGIGILAGFLLAILAVSQACGFQVSPVFWVALALIAGTGWADDLSRGLPVWIRLVIQVSAAAMIVGAMGGLSTFPLPAPADIAVGGLGWVLSVLWIVGVTNVYNFLDGIDGYAGVQGVVAGLGLALVGGGDLAVLGLAIAGACLGFLPHNWHRAKIFMGDVGSSSLGFLFAVLPFLGPVEERSRLIFSAGIFLWFFLSDGAFTLLRRTYRRERIWTAHRSHLYQRLVRSGLRHDRTVGVLGLGMVVLAMTFVLASRVAASRATWGSLILAALLFLGLLGWVWRRESRVT